MTVESTTHTARSRPLDHIRVGEAMHRGVLGCPFDTPLAEVARLMATHRIHAVVGLGDLADDETRLWGLVSDRDVVAMAAAGGDVESQSAGVSATTEVVTIGPHDSMRRAAQLMHEHGLSHVLVVEPGVDRPIGVVSTLDVAAAVGGLERETERGIGTRVGELMTKRVVSVAPELPLKDVAAILVDQGISGAPVVREGVVLGVVSEADIVAEERGEPAGRKRSFRWILRGEGSPIETRLAALTAGDAMSAPAITIEPWRSAASAATLMTQRRVKRLPVLADGTLVGIITRSDLVRAFVRSDEAIEREIRERIIVQEFWLLPSDIEVSVHRGRVMLTGTVDGEIAVEALPNEVQRVPGVVAVRSKLTRRGVPPSRSRRFRLG